VVITPLEVGAGWLEQLVTPPVPEIAKVRAPLGAIALALPVTVAVKVTDPPKVSEVGLAVNTTVGLAAATTVELLEAVAATAL
jgi:hypothetical protein